MSVTVLDIVKFLKEKNVNYYLHKDNNLQDEILGFSSLRNYKTNTIAWCKGIEFMPEWLDINEIKLLITDKKDIANKRNVLLVYSNPRTVFFDIVENFFSISEKRNGIGKGTVLGDKVKISESATVGSHCVIDGDIVIGENTIIGNNVVIVNKVSIGSNCTIQSATVIGEDGFAYSEQNGHKKMIKHYGGVEIHDDVHIGANCCVARGTIDNTIIEKGCKIDNLCHIAHNVILKKNVTLIAGSIIYGSAIIGENSYIASGLIKDNTFVANDNIIGMGSVVIKNMEQEGKTLVGIPAKVLNRREKK